MRVGVQDFSANPSCRKAELVRGVKETCVVGIAEGTRLCTETGCAIENPSKQAERLFLHTLFEARKNA